MASKPLSDSRIKNDVAELPGWKYRRNALEKTFIFGNFREALSFMVRSGFEAEAMDHHPNWTNVYNRVSVRLNTHDAGGKVTEKDFILARKFQELSWVG
ncbi:MAG: transcriptional coactivator/pterin dehydratase [Verrucomicrobia bacterium]|nr:transcriptional coactivator/pterin dehydratase [Verrucomicrobiota bacterium]